MCACDEMKLSDEETRIQINFILKKRIQLILQSKIKDTLNNKLQVHMTLEKNPLNQCLLSPMNAKNAQEQKKTQDSEKVIHQIGKF